LITITNYSDYIFVYAGYSFQNYSFWCFTSNNGQVKYEK